MNSRLLTRSPHWRGRTAAFDRGRAHRG